MTACLVLGALAVVQICVAAGAPWARVVRGGVPRVLPRRLSIAGATQVIALS
ncbi:hypothetical protein [Microbacterium sp. LWH3-1.2]|uniref:hypothetical protein n=1 Tax=Microbacterium sp. LWH3-1.2 TaxID=3135256 RepID=UPI003433172D